MAIISSSVNRFAAFGQVLPLLELRPPGPALPLAVRCPFCGKTAGLFIYRDVTYGGEWSHCRGCDFSGDMIELAAGVWKLDVRAAAAKLARLGALPAAEVPPAAVTAYLREHVER